MFTVNRGRSCGFHTLQRIVVDEGLSQSCVQEVDAAELCDGGAELCVEAALVRHGGAPALAGCYPVGMLHPAVDFSAEEHIVVEVEPLLVTSSSSLLRVPIEAVLAGTRVPAPLSWCA